MPKGKRLAGKASLRGRGGRGLRGSGGRGAGLAGPGADNGGGGGCVGFAVVPADFFDFFLFLPMVRGRERGQGTEGEELWENAGKAGNGGTAWF